MYTIFSTGSNGRAENKDAIGLPSLNDSKLVLVGSVL